MARGLGKATTLPVQVALYDHPGFHQTIQQEVARCRPDVAVLVLSRIGSVIPALQGVPLVLDLIDCLTLNLEQRGTRQRLWRPLLRWEARRMLAWDHQLIRQVQAATVVSERDRRALAVADPLLARRIHVVPLGLPASTHEARREACQQAVPAQRSPAQPKIVLLSGNLGYFPTADGARWFATKVWPEIRLKFPQAEFWLAGVRPTWSVRQLSQQPGIRVLAEPRDLDAVRRQASVAVAPLWAGSGTPIKILEAMAADVPVVTTPWGAAGLDGLHGDEVAIGEDPASFAAAVLRLLHGHDAVQQVQAAQSWLATHHTLARTADQFEQILLAAAANKPSFS